ncbi:hypothetical protein C5167_041852 [Papaver somniferum]|nr:hypothetical protein C5167_041852 [Papaver somniferum]
MAELRALKFGLELATQLQIPYLEVVSDSTYITGLVNRLQSPSDIDTGKHHAIPQYFDPPTCFHLLTVGFAWPNLRGNKDGKTEKYTPGPTRFPLIGNLHQITKLPHISFKKLSDKYGPIMFLKLGSVPTLVVSSASILKEMFTAHDLVFSNRPMLYAAKKFSYDFVDITFAPYGEYWREVRKITMAELLSVKRVQLFRVVRAEEVATLIELIHRSSSSLTPINLREMILCFFNNVICRVAFGRKYEEEIDTNGKKAKLEKTFGQMDDFYEKVIDKHLNPQRLTPAVEDLVDVLLRGYELDGYVNGDKPCPPATLENSQNPNPEYSPWLKQDHILLGWIFSSLTPVVLRQVHRLTTSRAVWTSLESLFASKSDAHIHHLQCELHALKKGSLSMRAYIDRARDLVDSLAAADTTVTNTELHHCILARLDSSYYVIVTSLTTSMGTMKLEDFITYILTFELHVEQQTKMLISTHVAAAASRNFSSQNTGLLPHPNNGTSNAGARQSTICQLCDKPGHLSPMCWKRFDRNFKPRPPRRNQPPQSPAHRAYVVENKDPPLFICGSLTVVLPIISRMI